MPRVLVVDDQADVRAIIAIVLRVQQFEIVEAASASEGLKAFGDSRFDVAIVDIFLKEESGADVIAAMRERKPDLPVVAISGMTALDFVSDSPELSNVVCLRKPFRANELLRAIEAARVSVRQSAPGVMEAARL